MLQAPTSNRQGVKLLRTSQTATGRATAAAQKPSQTAGIAYVGLSRGSTAEVSKLASQLKKSRGDAEVSFLPNEFNPKKPFANAVQLVKETIGGLAGKLRMSVDLKWFPHTTAAGANEQKAFWAAWGAAKPTAAQQKIRTDFLGRVHDADLFVGQAQAAATAAGKSGKVDVTFVPVLEDTDTSKSAYTSMVSAIRAQQKLDHIDPTPLRRSPVGVNNAFRVEGTSMELHGSWSQVKNTLVAGDTWNNDGTSYNSISAFAADEQQAKQAGMSVLYWNKDYNGLPTGATNEASRTVDAFTGANAAANAARLAQVIA